MSSSLPLSCLSSQENFDGTCTSHTAVCQTVHLSPFLPSFPGSADIPSAPSFCQSVCLASCLSCPGCVDSSSVSCRRSVLLRHGHWSDACTLSADGQATFSFSHFFSNFLLPQKFILLIPSLAAAQSPCHLSQSPSSSIADHLVAWQLTERETERQTDRKHTIP